MKAVVVFESMFGNTERIARAIAEGLAEHGQVDVVNVDDMGGPGPVDLLVVGGPTHAFGMSRRSTRKAAREQATGELVSRSTGVREWLSGIGTGSGSAAAAFGTHISKARRVPGSAVKGIAKRLRAKGYRQLAKPENFYVDDTLGPLTEAELERARGWGEKLGAAAAARVKQAGSR